MKRKNFLTALFKSDEPDKLRISKKLSNLTLYAGCLILISFLFYIIIHLQYADTILFIWLPFVLAGLFLIIISQLLDPEHRNL